jgi:hypothetical protein
MVTYNVYKLLKEELRKGSTDLVTRRSGKLIRELIERDIADEGNGEVVAIDFSGIGIIDYSCADEIAAKLISRLVNNEYGDRYIILAGLNENQKENIEVALERKDLAVMAEMKGGERALLGNLHNYLRDTLDVIRKKGRITAKELSDMKKVGTNTSGTRLLNLHKKRLVKKTDENRNGARVWVYERL